jgi:ketosteroid isomerase-like protein
MLDSEKTALITTLYSAFQNKDYATMADCYHPQAEFKDEAFTLQGKEVAAMWHMLIERGTGLSLTFSVTEKQGLVTAHWEPSYHFSQTGRYVHNIIDASFEFKDGKIYRHTDEFNFWRWSRQALGLPGLILGWTPLLKNKVSQMAMTNLKKFIEKHPEYQ